MILSCLHKKYFLHDNTGWVPFYTHLHLKLQGLAQLVERLTEEQEMAGPIPVAGPTLRSLKWLRNEGTAFALQMARPSRGWDDHVKWRSRLQKEAEK